jgi:CubicO group peptidase (beta-lactamase class C family)
MTEEVMVPSRCLYAVSHDGTIVNERASAAIVPWWSFTKTVIAAAALILVQDGRLQLDETLDGQPFTLRQLLQHRAGLPDYGTLPEYHAAVRRGNEPWPVSELLDRVRSGHLLHSPEIVWRYSNIDYLIVRQQIEHVTGADLDATLRSLVLGPLKVDCARIASKPSDLDNVTMGEASGYHPGWVYHGLLVGPVESAAVLLDRLLGTDLLAAQLREQMLQPYIVGGPTEDRPWNVPAYGLGMMCGDAEDGYRVAGHTGGGPASVIAAYRRLDSPSSGAAAVFLADGTQGEVERAAFELASQEASPPLEAPCPCPCYSFARPAPFVTSRSAASVAFGSWNINASIAPD